MEAMLNGLLSSYLDLFGQKQREAGKAAGSEVEDSVRVALLANR